GDGLLGHRRIEDVDDLVVPHESLLWTGRPRPERGGAGVCRALKSSDDGARRPPLPARRRVGDLLTPPVPLRAHDRARGELHTCTAAGAGPARRPSHVEPEEHDVGSWTT